MYVKKFMFFVCVFIIMDGWIEECVGDFMLSVKKVKDFVVFLFLVLLKCF